jgi:hypothetical protein
MYTLRWMGKGALPLVLLASLLLLPPNRVQAAAKPPIIPALEEAEVLLNSCQGRHLPQATHATRKALGILTHKDLFRGPPLVPPRTPLSRLPPLSPLQELLLDPPGGLHVLYNRHKAEVALKLLTSAKKQLELRILLLKQGPDAPDVVALPHVKRAIKEVRNFLLLPFIF